MIKVAFTTLLNEFRGGFMAFKVMDIFDNEAMDNDPTLYETIGEKKVVSVVLMGTSNVGRKLELSWSPNTPPDSTLSLLSFSFNSHGSTI